MLRFINFTRKIPDFKASLFLIEEHFILTELQANGGQMV